MDYQGNVYESQLDSPKQGRLKIFFGYAAGVGKTYAMLEAALTARGERPPSPWSQQARAWAESAGIVAGERVEERRYPAFATREETVQMLYRLSQAQGPVSSAPPETR